ncbi:MAG: NAD(P)H-hydrate dehydratase [Alphaproteobacteria bacterium]
MTDSHPAAGFAGPHGLLSAADMYAADRSAVAGGISGFDLMAAAGRAVARQVLAHWGWRSTVVLCGPGNNGGDGFVIARILSESGWPVSVALLGRPEALGGDAAAHAALWRGPIRALDPAVLDGAELVIDALFGAGLDRPLTGMAAAVVGRLSARTVPVVAVDMPSGVHSDSGVVLGCAAAATLTVTFVRRKPGHLIYPGRRLAGRVIVADIGMAQSVIESLGAGHGPAQAVNHPDLWRARLPTPQADGHKFRRGHAAIVAGDRMTGAGRLAALAAQRAGAGMVSLLCPPSAVAHYAQGFAAKLVAPLNGPADLVRLMAEHGRNALLLGPGNGIGPATRGHVLAVLGLGLPAVLDADALTVFADGKRRLFAAITGPAVLTPHPGEFRSLFAWTGDRLADAREAARRSGAVVVLKGADTVVAAPDGRATINDNAPPDLATAGAGDVLAGLVVGLLAQGMGPFDAACAAVWLHGAAAAAAGPGLIADDLPAAVPAVLRALRTGPDFG